jgi:ribonuclease T1
VARGRTWCRIAGVIATAAVALAVAGCTPAGGAPGGGAGAPPPAAGAAQTRPGGPVQAAAKAVATPRSGLATVRLADLPKEARRTVELIGQGGPFPFQRDGITYQNREKILPKQSQGYYREYTVVTPGSKDRGARRVVAGRAGELYYSDDHYQSFREVVR